MPATHGRTPAPRHGRERRPCPGRTTASCPTRPPGRRTRIVHPYRLGSTPPTRLARSPRSPATPPTPAAPWLQRPRIGFANAGLLVAPSRGRVQAIQGRHVLLRHRSTPAAPRLRGPLIAACTDP